MGLVLALPALALCQSPLSLGDPLASAPRLVSEIIIDDLDGDGRSDLLTLDQGAMVFHGPLDGGGEGLRLRELDGPVTGAAVGDLNGDGVNDIVLALDGPAGPQIVRHLGLPGGRSYERQAPVAIVSSLSALELADIDGDGRLDLLGIAELGDALRDYRGTSSGFAFQSPQPIVSFGVDAFRVDDLTGDGVPDILMDREGRSRLLIGDGAGGFGAPITFPWTVDPNAPNARGYLLSDFDLDGIADVLLSDSDTLTLERGRGDGTFDPPVPVSPSLPGRSLTFPTSVADLDGDGDLDAVGYMDVGFFDFRPCTYENLGSGTFGPPLEVRSSSILPVQPDRVADLVGDALPDVVSGTDPFVGVHPGLGLGVFDLFDTVPADWLPFRSAYNGRYVGDFDGDGDLDVVSHGFQDVSELIYVEAIGAGVFAAPRAVATPFGSAVSLQVADVDQDGDDDLAAVQQDNTTDDFALALFDGDTVALFASVPGAGLYLEGLPQLIADLDGDGDTDVLRGTDGTNEITMTLHLGDGAGGFQVGGTFGTLAISELADLNGDGLDDVLEFSSTAREVQWRQNLGGAFAAPVILVSALPPGLFPRRILRGDVDGDQTEDLILLTEGSESVLVRRLAGGVTFASPVTFTLPGVVNGIAASGRLLDVDGDGTLDIYLREFVAGSFTERYFAGDGTGQFAAGVTVPPAPFRFLGPFADLDQDGDLDAIAVDSTLGMWLALGSSVSSIGESICGPAAPNLTGVPASLRAFEGSAGGAPRIDLRAVGLPPNQFGMVAGSLTSVPATAVPGSAGRICIGGAIGRYDDPGQILFSGPSGAASLEIDPAALETPFGPVPAQAGQRWFFQVWYRDVAGGMATSNFSDALAIQF